MHFEAQDDRGAKVGTRASISTKPAAGPPPSQQKGPGRIEMGQSSRGAFHSPDVICTDLAFVAVRFWGKLLEHFIDSLVEILLVVLRIFGQSVGCTAAEDELFILRFIHVDDDSVVCDRGSRYFGTPTAHAIIEGLVFLLVLSRANRCDDNVRIGIGTLPAFLQQCSVNGIADTEFPTRIGGRHLAPGIGVVALEQNFVVVVNADFLCLGADAKRAARTKRPKSLAMPSRRWTRVLRWLFMASVHLEEQLREGQQALSPRRNSRDPEIIPHVRSPGLRSFSKPST